MSSPAARRIAGASGSEPVFPDEILEEIFLRLDAAEDLARAAAACTAFRRVVSARRFLRRFRFLHPTRALGILVQEFRGFGAFHPAEPPHHSAPTARALARAADFTLSFLGDPDRWQVCDVRDGRVLLYRQVKVTLMVCDPLHRRQVQLPRIPGMASAAQTPGWNGFPVFDSFLAPATNAEEEQDLSFRVICVEQHPHSLLTFHFSPVTRKWQSITFNRPVPFGPSDRFIFGRWYAHGCFFWRISSSSSFMVMLSMHEMKLSVIVLPPGKHDNLVQTLAIVEAGEGTIGLFTVSDHGLQLFCKSLQGTEWRHERIIPFPKLNCYWNLHNAAAGYLLLEAMPKGSYLFGNQQFFTLNLKTFLVESLCILNQYIGAARLYASFLLPFSQPSI